MVWPTSQCFFTQLHFPFFSSLSLPGIEPATYLLFVDGQTIGLHPVQLTTSRIGNLTRLIHTLLYVMTIHTVCVCVLSSHSFWTSSSLDVPAGVTQEEGHTGFLIHLLSAVRALIFLVRRIQPFLSLVDCEVEFCVLTI